MTQNPYNTFAKDWLDMWQAHCAKGLSDPNLVNAMLDMLKNIPHTPAYASTGPTEFTTSAYEQPQPVAKLEARIRALEQRIAELESAAAKPGKPATGSQKRRTAGSAKKAK